MWTDTHCHAYPPYFEWEEVGRMAEEAADLRAAIVVGETLADAKKILTMRINKLYPAIGLHPVQVSHSEGNKNESSVKFDLVEEMETLVRENQGQLVAIGEIGLDFSPHIVAKNDETTKEEQRRVFKHQIKVANELDLPVSVHSRQAGHHALECLIQQQAKSVVMHAFDGKERYVQLGVKEGFYFSVPPSFTVKQNSWVSRVPLDRLLIETDCPALSHVKGERNLLKNGRVSLEFIAKEHKIPVNACAQLLEHNVRKVFKNLP